MVSMSWAFLPPRVYPAAVVMTASAPVHGGDERVEVEHVAAGDLDTLVSSLLASVVERTRARTLLPRSSSSSTTLPPREPVAPTTRTGRVGGVGHEVSLSIRSVWVRALIASTMA